MFLVLWLCVRLDAADDVESVALLSGGVKGDQGDEASDLRK